MPRFYRNRVVVILCDALLISIAFILSYYLRFSFDIPAPEFYWAQIKRTLPFVVALNLIVFYRFDLYKGMWRYTGIRDLRAIIFAVTLSTVIMIVVLTVGFRFAGYPRSVFVINWFILIVFIGGFRFQIRMVKEIGYPFIWRLQEDSGARKKLMIVGAGDAGELILREILQNPRLGYDPVCFVDDDPNKLKRKIHGVPVLGPVEEIPRLPCEFDEILIAISSGKGEEMRRIVAACERTGKRYRTVPGIGELIGGKVSVKAIREVTLEDLLGREEVHLDQEEIARYLRERRVLVTGAGGSIGSELVRQVSRFQPQAVALLEVSELNLFRVEMECRQRFGHVSISGFLVDVRDREAVGRVFREFAPQVVFHAAAYKHVPIQELHPWESVQNNVLGTRNLVNAAVEASLERFVLVSTDKAVRPTSVMGATKRVAEMLVECVNGISGPRFMSVRFGNVIGSSGSAIPIFQEQIARGGPVTVTDPEVTRYFMSISEAAQLILQAGAMGEGGEIFILDMGKPVRIVDIARDLIRLHGFEPDQDIPIQFIGLRPGEKLCEELITQGEGIVATAHEKILVLRGNACDLKNLNAQIDELLTIACTYDPPSIKRKLQQIVPDYTPHL
jgi:FlaA1/EpsC-like NDP-sugar epimerase